GTTDDRALEEVYGFNVDGLDQRWREWIGAPPRPANATGSTSATPQAVPTLSLYTLPQSSQPPAATAVASPAAAVASKQATPVGETASTAVPAPAATQDAAPAAQTTQGGATAAGASVLGLFVIAVLAAIVVIIGIVLFFLVRARRAMSQ
ncbi:MAG TPA: hypothetical protein VHL09_03630, partial [Dehalococcoidia bacterium]|nr:hypothetical protein [Dehalococcoidia bacterium]